MSFSLIWSAVRAVIRVPCASSPLSPPDLSSVVSCCLSSSRLIPHPLPRPAWSKVVSPGLVPHSLVMTEWSDLPQGRGPSARSDMVAALTMADEPRPPRGATGASSESTGGGSRRGTRLTSRGGARENGLRISYPLKVRAVPTLHRHMSRISSWISLEMAGRPGFPVWLNRRQYSRNCFFCRR